jgi:hypothetical protein
MEPWCHGGSFGFQKIYGALANTVSGRLGTEAAAEVLAAAGDGRAAVPTGAFFSNGVRI